MIQVISDGWSCTVNHIGLISASWVLSNAHKNSMDIKQHYLIIKMWINIFPILVMQRILVIYLSVIFFFLRERFWLGGLCWPETDYIDLVSIELTEICWPLLELKAYWSKITVVIEYLKFGSVLGITLRDPLPDILTILWCYIYREKGGLSKPTLLHCWARRNTRGIDNPRLPIFKV